MTRIHVLTVDLRRTRFITFLLDGVMHVFFVLVFGRWSVAAPVFVSLRTPSRSPWQPLISDDSYLCPLPWEIRPFFILILLML